MNNSKLEINIYQNSNGQFTSSLSFDNYGSGLDCAGSSIRDSVMGLLQIMSAYKFDSIQDVEEFIFKARGVKHGDDQIT